MNHNNFDQIHKLLDQLYPDQDSSEIISKVKSLIQKNNLSLSNKSSEQLSEKDIALITYAHILKNDSEKPLKTMISFLNKHLNGKINTIHFLPFYPHSSDHGFSVIDYNQVDPAVGNWEDVEEVDENFKLMFDLVINHCSRENLWFADLIEQKEPGKDFFIEFPLDTDVSTVTRPRNNPILTPAYTREGVKYVWATFSEDQIDLNFRNPQVLLNFIDILLFYVSKGASIIRLDAIGYIWKELGTTCLNLPQAHYIVKIFKLICNSINKDVKIITETNVPHVENIKYFGNGDEADLIYQFSLPPLLLHALYTGEAQYLSTWLENLETPPEGCYYFNFLASHDGVGLRPLEGIVPKDEVESLIRGMKNLGAFTTMRTGPDGKEIPYEINISLFDAMRVSKKGNDSQFRTKRFICAHAFQLCLQGVPGLYIHSLLATQNDIQGVQSTNITRQINRKIWDYEELEGLLSNQITPNAIIFNELSRLLSIRSSHKEFSPSSNQEIVMPAPSVIIVKRTIKDSEKFVLCIFNLSNQMIETEIDNKITKKIGSWYDLMSSNDYVIEDKVCLEPYQALWLVKRRFKLFF